MKFKLSDLRLSIIDRYIIMKYLKTFFYSVLLFTLIAIFIDISEKMDDFIKRKPPLSVLVFDYYIYFIPYFMGVFSPVFVFLSVMFFNSKLAQNTEIIAMLNSGVPYMRFLKPYLMGSVFLFGLFIYLNTHIIPKSEFYRLKFEDDWIHEKKSDQSNHINYMINDSTMFSLESFNYGDSSGINVGIDGFTKQHLKTRISAARMYWLRDKQMWRLENYQRRNFDVLDKEFVQVGSYFDTLLDIKPDEFVVKANSASSLTNPELNEYIRKETAKGTIIVPKLKVELYKRIAVPVSYIILTLLAVSVSSKKSRGGTGFHMGLGLFIMFIYLLLIQIFNTSGNAGVLAPWIAVWLPPILFMFVALIMVRYAPK